MSFTSTLYLHPILELLLDRIPESLKSDIRLGLQEALVNAAKHGNHLDPSKAIVVQFTAAQGEYSWTICDRGLGFSPPCPCHAHLPDELPPEEAERGRGLCILHQIFDRVQWIGGEGGTQLKLCKEVKRGKKFFPWEGHLAKLD